MQEDTETDEGGTSTTIGTEQQQEPMKLCGQHVQAKPVQDDTCQHECTVHILKLLCQGHMMQEGTKIDEGGTGTTIGTEQAQYPIKL